jgi:hypothetical protein
MICWEHPILSHKNDNGLPKVKSFKKIFAILVMIEKTSNISRFLAEDLNDLTLPLSDFRRGEGLHDLIFEHCAC